MGRENRWIGQIAELQRPDGSWGDFHTLRSPTKEKPITTEQALRRLKILGMTGEDAPIQRALAYMKAVLRHRAAPPDRRERALNWDFFEGMMMAAWIREFSPGDEDAAPIAAFWADIVTSAFASGGYDREAYERAYRMKIPKLHPAERLIAISQFYMVSLLKGELGKRTEDALVEHVLQSPEGIYYVYPGRMDELPPKFDSLQSSRYIGALECLAGYDCAPQKLAFAAAWLYQNQGEDGWDLGSAARDGVYFPVSDSWRRREDRVRDCTGRIQRLLDKMKG